MAEVAAQLDAVNVDDWIAVSPGCPMCDERAVIEAAIDIVIDGDQIAEDCHDCGRLVRPFSWHLMEEGLPSAYVGRRLPTIGTSNVQHATVFALYERTGAVKAVPAIERARPDRVYWAASYNAGTLARAVLAHLVGLDVSHEVWRAFEDDVTSSLPVTAAGEWTIPMADIAAWLEANR